MIQRNTCFVTVETVALDDLTAHVLQCRLQYIIMLIYDTRGEGGLYLAWDRASGFLSTLHAASHWTPTPSCCCLATGCAVEMTCFRVLRNPNCAHSTRKCTSSSSFSLVRFVWGPVTASFWTLPETQLCKCSLRCQIPGEPFVSPSPYFTASTVRLTHLLLRPQLKFV